MKSARDIKLLKKFGAHLRQLREEKKFSIRGLADEADIDASYVVQLEKGIKNPSLLMLLKISGALGISINDLVNEKKFILTTSAITKLTSAIDHYRNLG